MIVRKLIFLAVICFITKTIHGNVENKGTNQFIARPIFEQVALGQFPSFVFLERGPSRTWICSGFIVNVNHVVTTGFCVIDANRQLISTNSIGVLAGANVLPLAAPVFPVTVSRIYIHPLYNPWTLDNDIAVLRTTLNLPIQEGLVQNIFPGQIHDRIISTVDQCRLVGIFSGPHANRPLDSQAMPIISRADCNLLSNNGVPPSQFCAGPLIPIQPSQTTHGGPLFCGNQVVGILSHRLTNGQGIQAFTQLRLYLSWITEQFTRQDIPIAGPTQPPSFPISELGVILDPN